MLILENIDRYHPPLEWTFLTEATKRTEAPSSKQNFFKANYDLINSDLLDIDWDLVLNDRNINVNDEKLYEIINQHVPFFHQTVGSFP